MRVAAEVMAQDPERADRVPEGRRGGLGGLALDEIGAQRLVLALLGLGRVQEELATFA